MIKMLRQLLRKTKKNVIPVLDVLDEHDLKPGDQVEPHSKDGKFVCPICHHDKFAHGAQGGLGVMLTCEGCGTEWSGNSIGFKWMYATPSTWNI